MQKPDLKPKLNELSAKISNFKTISAKFKEIAAIKNIKQSVKADMNGQPDDMEDMRNQIDCAMCDMWDAIYSLSNQIYSCYEATWNMMQEHETGHLPPILSSEQMTNAIKSLGLSKEYTVAPKTIYAETK